jgi:Mor family transcriptional regulator
MKQEEFYQHICKKYPQIEYNGEDLNLNNIYANLVAKTWYDKVNYPNVKEISKKLGISERHIYRIAQKHGLGMRYYNQNK